MKTIHHFFFISILLLTISGCRKDIHGCTILAASNFNPNATVNDGSCIIPVRGCTDMAADNYNSAATINDGSCVYPTPVRGCTDPASANYNSAATIDDGSCVYPTGQVMFWFDANNGTGTVNIAGQTGTITGYVTGGVPSCGNSVSATFTLRTGQYQYTVSSTGGSTWSGTAVVTDNGCQAYQLR